MKEVPASSNRLALLKGGAVDVVAYLQPRERISLKGDANVKIVELPAGADPLDPLHDEHGEAVRQQARSAGGLLRAALRRHRPDGGPRHGAAAEAPLPANYEFYAPQLDPYKTNIEKAKALLSRPAIPNGFSTSIGFSNDDPTVEQQASIVQNALAKIGIKASLLKQPFATYTQNWLGAKYQMGMMYEGAFIPDFTYALSLWYYGPKKKNFLDFTDYHNAEVNGWLDKANSTFDEAERKQLATSIQMQIMDDAPMCYLVEPGVHLPARKNIGGINYWTYSAQHFDLLDEELDVARTGAQLRGGGRGRCAAARVPGATRRRMKISCYIAAASALRRAAGDRDLARDVRDRAAAAVEPGLRARRTGGERGDHQADREAPRAQRADPHAVLACT